MIKLLAIIFMFIDHFAICLLPESTPFYVACRLIGRLSMPLFAYGIAKGCYYTLKKGTYFNYLRRIILLFILSQVPFALMEHKSVMGGFNVCLSWFLSAFFIGFFMDKSFGERFNDVIRFLIFGLWLGMVFYANLTFGIDYGFMGVFLPIIFYHCYLKCFKGEKKEPPIYTTLLLFALWAVYNFVERDGLQMPQLLIVFTIPLISLLSPIDGKVRVKKWIGYLAYPVSMILFWAISLVIK